MSQKQIYASLDIGSSTIKLLVGEIVNHNVRVLRVETVPSRGVRRGIVFDKQLVVEDIKALITKVEYLLNIKIESVILNIPSICLDLYQGRGSHLLKREDKIVQKMDIQKALYASRNFEVPKEEVVVSVIPLSYIYDGHQTRKPPLGKTARQVVVNSLVITAPKEMVYPLAQCVEEAGLGIMDIVVSAYSQASEALDEVYLQEGVILIDMGAQVTMVTVFENGYLRTLGSLPLGGYQITKDIARHLSIEMSQAEQLKIKFGLCNPSIADEDVLHIQIQEDGKEKPFTQKDLAEIIRQRVNHQMYSIFEQIEPMINEQPYSIVIVGGGSQLEGIEELISQVLGSHSKIYTPDTIGARQSIYTANLGAIYYLADRMNYLVDVGSSVDLKNYEQAISVRKSILKGIGNDEGTLLNRIVDFLFGEEHD